MINLKDLSKKDNTIMRSLKISEIRHVLAHTDKGDLCLMLPFKGTNTDYRFVLDAVPVDDKKNRELMTQFNGFIFEI